MSGGVQLYSCISRLFVGRAFYINLIFRKFIFKIGVLIGILLFGVQLVASYFATRIAGKEKE
jgi:hypothetical protein